jgi:hypothetical protein
MLFSGISQGTAFLDRQIDFILINADTGIHFTTVEPMENPDNCNQSDFYKVENGGTYESEIYSMLLAKKAAKEPVSFDITGCTANGRQKIMWVR